jgi:hypothetical protein
MKELLCITLFVSTSMIAMQEDPFEKLIQRGVSVGSAARRLANSHNKTSIEEPESKDAMQDEYIAYACRKMHGGAIDEAVLKLLQKNNELEISKAAACEIYCDSKGREKRSYSL